VDIVAGYTHGKVFGSSLREGEVDFSSFYVRFLEYSKKLVAQSVKFERKSMFKNSFFTSLII
jgi:hypothetical protein